MNFKVKSRRDIISGYIPSSDAVLITVTIPSDVYPSAHKDYKDILRLKFDDVDEGTDDLIVFDHSMAYRILQFVDDYIDNVDTIVVNCDAGMSRSAGIACSLSYIINGDDKEIVKKYPLHNRKVYGTIISEWNNLGRFVDDLNCMGDFDEEDTSQDSDI